MASTSLPFAVIKRVIFESPLMPRNASDRCCFSGNRSKNPGQKSPDNKPTRIIAKYAVDANLFRLGSTNLQKKYPVPVFFLGDSMFGEEM